MLDAMSLPFMQRALEAGILVALVAGFLGVFVVQRGQSFMGDGLAHAAFGGVALGILLGLDELWVALPFTVAVAIAIVWVHQRTSLHSDTATGIFFAVSMALGIIFLSLRREYTRDAFSVLFGSILSVSAADLWLTRGAGVLALFTIPFWSRWAYSTVDPELARADRLPVFRDDYFLAVALAITVVIASKVVGILMVAAFLVIPAASARLVVRRFSSMTLLSVVVGIVSVIVGLLLSYQLDLPSGPTIVLTQAALFIAALCVRR